MSSDLRIAPLFVAVAASLAVGFAPARATAQPASPKEDIAALEKQLASEVTALSTSDCMAACRALASIRRAADKICGLDPGERCAAARAKADDASRRVRESCPDCAIASAPGASPPADVKASEVRSKATPEAPSPTSAPPSESKRGGCAGCTTTKATHGDVAGVALFSLVLARMLRRRRR
ncbi:MAG: hypothetical protein JST00_25475 [Deltaproteobacteria bacterium]|nr:hypothetical protein [Deltaproteobacteria bacterium]